MKPAAPPKPFLRKLAALPRAALNCDLEPILDLVFDRLEFLFVRAERDRKSTRLNSSHAT